MPVARRRRCGRDHAHGLRAAMTRWPESRATALGTAVRAASHCCQGPGTGLQANSHRQAHTRERLFRRMKCAAQSERFSLEQKSLIGNEIAADLAADLAAVACGIDALTRTKTSATADKKPSQRLPQPAHLLYREARHKPASTSRTCGRQIKNTRREGCGQEAGVGARWVQRRARCLQQLGMHPVPEHSTGAGSSPRHRQMHPHHRPAGPGAGG
jgi:hypothetical protein